jgi:hypothetical protein
MLQIGIARYGSVEIRVEPELRTRQKRAAAKAARLFRY